MLTLLTIALIFSPMSFAEECIEYMENFFSNDQESSYNQMMDEDDYSYMMGNRKGSMMDEDDYSYMMGNRKGSMMDEDDYSYMMGNRKGSMMDEDDYSYMMGNNKHCFEDDEDDNDSNQTRNTMMGWRD